MPPVGLAHVATASFLASRATPTGGFAVALAGGVALARAGERHGLRQGYGASLASLLQTVAIMGPARIGVPLTQAITAPLVGRLHTRGWRAPAQIAVVSLIRAAQNALGLVFYVYVLLGVEAYTGSYEELVGFLPVGPFAGTLLGLGAWALGASSVQVLVYRRGLRRWPAGHAPEDADSAGAAPPGHSRGGRFDPRAVALAALVAGAILLASTEPLVLGAVAAWLALAWLAARGDRSAVRPGLVLTALLAGGTLAGGLIGGIGAELALRRAARAGLLVLAATWLRSAAGREGLREVFRRALGRTDRLPAVREAVPILDGLGSTSALTSSGRALLGDLRGVRRRPLPVVDAVLGWVAREAGRHQATTAPAVALLRARALDAALLASALVPAIALAL